MICRKAKDSEIAAINEALKLAGWEPFSEKAGNIFVVDNYVSDGPSWCGKFAMVLGGEVGLITVLRFDNRGHVIRDYTMLSPEIWIDCLGEFEAGWYSTYDGKEACVVVANAPGRHALKGYVKTKEGNDSFACEWDSNGLVAGGFGPGLNLKRVN